MSERWQDDDPTASPHPDPGDDTYEAPDPSPYGDPTTPSVDDPSVALGGPGIDSALDDGAGEAAPATADPTATTGSAETADPTAPPDPGAPARAPAEPPVLNPAAAATVAPVTAGPLTVPPTGADRDVLPGITDLAGDLGHALGVGQDELGLVEVEVNGLMGVRVHLVPGLVPLGTEQAGHCLATALEEARSEVVGHLTEYFRANEVTAEWLETRPGDQERATGAVGTAPTDPPRQRAVTSPDGLVTVVIALDQTVASVVINAAVLDLDSVADAFVAAAEAALQGSGEDVAALDPDSRVAQFDGAIARIEKSLDDLDQQLDAVLKGL